MRVHTVRIPSLDLSESEDFYSLLFGIGKTFGDETQGCIGFVLENVSILLEPIEAGEFDAGRYLGFSLEVPDVLSLYNRLNEVVRFSGPPQEQEWGGIMTHVTDSSGNTLSIVEVSSNT